MNASDRAALEIGRMFMRAHSAEARLEEALGELGRVRAQLARYEDADQPSDQPVGQERTGPDSAA